MKFWVKNLIKASGVTAFIATLGITIGAAVKDKNNNPKPIKVMEQVYTTLNKIDSKKTTFYFPANNVEKLLNNKHKTQIINALKKELKFNLHNVELDIKLDNRDFPLNYDFNSRKSFKLIVFIKNGFNSFQLKNKFSIEIIERQKFLEKLINQIDNEVFNTNSSYQLNELLKWEMVLKEILIKKYPFWEEELKKTKIIINQINKSENNLLLFDTNFIFQDFNVFKQLKITYQKEDLNFEQISYKSINDKILKTNIKYQNAFVKEWNLNNKQDHLLLTKMLFPSLNNQEINHIKIKHFTIQNNNLILIFDVHFGLKVQNYNLSIPVIKNSLYPKIISMFAPQEKKILPGVKNSNERSFFIKNKSEFDNIKAQIKPQMDDQKLNSLKKEMNKNLFAMNGYNQTVANNNNDYKYLSQINEKHIKMYDGVFVSENVDVNDIKVINFGSFPDQKVVLSLVENSVKRDSHLGTLTYNVKLEKNFQHIILAITYSGFSNDNSRKKIKEIAKIKASLSQKFLKLDSTKSAFIDKSLTANVAIKTYDFNKPHFNNFFENLADSQIKIEWIKIRQIDNMLFYSYRLIKNNVASEEKEIMIGGFESISVKHSKIILTKFSHEIKNKVTQIATEIANNHKNDLPTMIKNEITKTFLEPKRTILVNSQNEKIDIKYFVHNIVTDNKTGRLHLKITFNYEGELITLDHQIDNLLNAKKLINELSLMKLDQILDGQKDILPSRALPNDLYQKVPIKFKDNQLFYGFDLKIIILSRNPNNQNGQIDYFYQIEATKNNEKLFSKQRVLSIKNFQTLASFNKEWNKKIIDFKLPNKLTSLIDKFSNKYEAHQNDVSILKNNANHTSNPEYKEDIWKKLQTIKKTVEVLNESILKNNISKIKGDIKNILMKNRIIVVQESISKNITKVKEFLQKDIISLFSSFPIDVKSVLMDKLSLPTYKANSFEFEIKWDYEGTSQTTKNLINTHAIKFINYFSQKAKNQLKLEKAMQYLKTIDSEVSIATLLASANKNSLAEQIVLRFKNSLELKGIYNVDINLGLTSQDILNHYNQNYSNLLNLDKMKISTGFGNDKVDIDVNWFKIKFNILAREIAINKINDFLNKRVKNLRLTSFLYSLDYKGDAIYTWQKMFYQELEKAWNDWGIDEVYTHGRVESKDSFLEWKGVKIALTKEALATSLDTKFKTINFHIKYGNYEREAAFKIKLI